MALFTEQDVELLEDVLDLVPDLDAVAFAAKLARERIGYPIESHEGLSSLFEDGRQTVFKGRRITMDDAVRFLPRTFFPIDSERDLLCKLMIAFQRGRLVHLEEQRRETPESPVLEEEVTILPSAAPGVLEV